MELCGVSSKLSDEVVICNPPLTHSTDVASVEAADPRHISPSDPFPPPPVTPVSCSAGNDTWGTPYQGASPSPLYLNPMTDDDWSSRKLSSKLKLTLSEFDSRQLLDGVQLTLLLQGQARKPVTMKFDAGKAMICIFFDNTNATTDGDEKKLNADGPESNFAPIQIPIKSVAGWKQTDSDLTLHLKSACSGMDEFLFLCPSLAQKDSIVDGLKTFMDFNRPFPKRKLLPKMKSSSMDGNETEHLHRGDGEAFSPLDGRFSPVSLTEDPSREEATSPGQVSPLPLGELSTSSSSPRRVRVHETCISSYYDFHDNCCKPLSTPAEQGMELTLIDASLEKDKMRFNFIDMPVLRESFSTDSTVLAPNSDNSFVGCNPINPGDLFGSSVSANPLWNAPMNINPWCANDVCTITSVTEAFGDLFGAGVKESKDAEKSHLIECDGADIPYVQCLGVSHSRLRQQESEDAVDAKVTMNNDAIRNRSKSIHRQAEHWQGLKNDMTFEVVWRGLSNVQRTKSLDETDSSRMSGQHRPSSFLESVLSQLYAIPFSADEINAEDDGVLYYDSDPEDARERSFQGGSRQSDRYELRRVPRLRLPHAILHSRSLSDGDIKTVVDMMKSCTFYFLWHPFPTTEIPLPKPCCVQAWIERGTYLYNQHFVQPKFMWKPVHEAQLVSRRKINMKVEKFDLLEIARIDENPAFIDRSIHPLAHQPSCFSIKTKCAQYLFQAPSVEEKIHVVFGLKLAVARLASLLICRDMAAVEEFFEPTEAAVPGHAPTPATVTVWLPE